MAVYKRGYQRYAGPITGPWTRFLVLPLLFAMSLGERPL
jgi:hypothetical protein